MQYRCQKNGFNQKWIKKKHCNEPRQSSVKPIKSNNEKNYESSINMELYEITGNNEFYSI